MGKNNAINILNSVFLFSQTGFGLLNEGYGASSGVDESVLELDRDGDCTRYEHTHV